MTLVIRHGLSEANNRHNFGNLAFASSEAPLMREGLVQAIEAREHLNTLRDMSKFDDYVAVSSMLRTQQTASAMGLHRQIIYPELREVPHGIEPLRLRTMLDAGELPDTALQTAERILENPPREEIWFTHGLVIAGLCKVLGVSHGDWRLIPRFCEIRELPLGELRKN